MRQGRVVRATESAVATARSSKSVAARVVLILAVSGFALRPLIASAATAPGLGKARTFAVLAGQGVTNTGPTVVRGNLGTTPAAAVTGFPPGLVHGVIHQADAFVLTAQNNLTAAYNNAAGQTPATIEPSELGTLTLLPGIYNADGGPLQITGTLTLDGGGDPASVFIFQTDSTLITASGSNVAMINGASPCNVFWQVGSSATLGTGSTFRGNIMALTSIQVQTNVTVIGRVMARNASVTLDSDTISAALCGANTTPQVAVLPSGGVQTGGGSTAGLQDVGLLALGGALVAISAGTFAMRRRAMRRG